MAQLPASRATSLSAIGEETDAARHLTLLSNRNALAPISVLPPELLARIFRFHALVESLWSGMLHLGQIRVTHVCRQWRQVALDDSSLWATFTGFWPREEWISEALVRARNAPLVIDFDLTPSLRKLSKFIPHISHIRELRLRNLYPSPFQLEDLQEICALEAPILEHFELALDPGTYFPVPSLTYRELVGTTLFNGRTPKLRTLSLTQIPIPWSLLPRGQLTQLEINLFEEISTADTDISRSVDLDQLVDLLINSPELEGLVLEFCLTSMLPKVSHEKSIHLPRLSRLRLSGSTFSVANLLSLLRLPPSTTLYLHCCISEDPSTYPDHSILPLVSAHFRYPAPAEFNDLRITVNAEPGRHIYVAASVSLPQSTCYHSHLIGGDTDSKAELTLSFHWHEWTEFDYSIQRVALGQLCSMLSILNLKFLSISVPDPVCSIDWFELFQHCKKITTIQLKGPGTRGLLHSLACPKPTNAISSRGEKSGDRDDRITQPQATSSAAGAHAAPPPFPKLRALLLEDLQFGEALPHLSVLYNVLAYLLRRRKEDETPLSKLCVYRCVISTRQVNCMRRLVQELCWDCEEAPSDYEW